MLRAPHAGRQPALRPPRRDLVGRGFGPQRCCAPSINPARFGYMRRILTRAASASTRPARDVLDVGCGGGLLAEEFAGLGCSGHGRRPLRRESLEAARAHARARAASRSSTSTGHGRAAALRRRLVRHRLLLRRARARRRPAAYARRDARASCGPAASTCTTPSTALAAASWSLIKLFQEWRSTALHGAEPARLGHVHQAAELVAALARAGLRATATSSASGRRRNPLSPIIRDMRSRARGDMTFGEFGARNVMREMRDTSLALRRLRDQAA